MNEKLKEYIDKNLELGTFIKFNKFKYGNEDASCTRFMDEERDAQRIDRSYLDYEYDKDESPDDNEFFKIMDIATEKQGKSCLKNNKIDKYINDEKNDNKFQQMLFDLIDERNLKDSDVYNKVHIDRRLFSKIRSDQNYHPSKETILLLGLALELREGEIERLLDSAAYSLPKNNVYDLIIRFCFVEGIYELKEVNSLLESYNCKLFSY